MLLMQYYRGLAFDCKYCILEVLSLYAFIVEQVKDGILCYHARNVTSFQSYGQFDSKLHSLTYKPMILATEKYCVEKGKHHSWL